MKESTKTINEVGTNNINIEAELDKGNPIAMNNLGSMYYMGKNGEPDYEKAKYYYELSHKAGYRLATTNLAYCYYYGLGTEQDYSKAYMYFTQAALVGQYEAMMKVGDMYKKGQFVEANPNMAARCYFAAHEYMSNYQEDDSISRGSVLHRLGDLFFEGCGVEEDWKQAYVFYQLAENAYSDQINAGDKFAMKAMGNVIEREEIVKRVLGDQLIEYELM